MKVSEIMSKDVKTCGPDDTLNEAARIMWENDCGFVPVVHDGRLLGTITDRDICMAVYTQNAAPTAVRVASAMAHDVHTIREDASVTDALQKMADKQIRRMPVVDASGQLVGVVATSDVTVNALKTSTNGGKRDELTPESVLKTLAAVSWPRGEAKPDGAVAQKPAPVPGAKPKSSVARM